MKAIFDQISDSCSKHMTKTYSTSFSLGINFLSKKFHVPIYGIYGFVRAADEIVDSFHDFDKEKLMAKFRSDTVDAIEDRISLNPILNSFQNAVHAFNISWDSIDTFLKSMEMDLNPTLYKEDNYKQYIVGSAEVVGLMCLKVFSENDEKLYDALKPYARYLGSAFQKVNFLRDMKADFEVLGRTYFPNVNLHRFDTNDKLEIEADIEKDFKTALIGIKKLPSGARGGVYLAFVYYYKLFTKIKATPAQQVLTARIRIPKKKKLVLMFQSLVKNKLNLL